MTARSLAGLHLLIGVLVSLCLSPAFSFDLPRIPGGASIPIPGADKLLKDKPAITTGINDAVTEVVFLDTFGPKSFAPMTRLKRGPRNAFILSRPGLFALDCRSYCLHAGVHGPTKGDGYLYARLAGPRAAVIRKIGQNSVAHPEIPQHTVQTLIWAILAKTRISEMGSEERAAAAKLLSPEEIKDLDGGALGAVPRELLERVMGSLPPIASQVMEAEATLRGMLTGGSASFAEIERIAVLTGEHERGEGSRDVPEQRWSYHPDGYFLRFFPHGYSRTRIELHLPEPFEIVRDGRNRITRVANGWGERIEIDYDDETAPLAFTGDPNVKAYAFRSVRLVRPRAIGPEIVVLDKAEWGNVGWTLVGAPSGKGSAAAAGRFDDPNRRYKAALAALTEVEGLAKRLAKLKDPKPPTPNIQAVREELADLAHLSIAIREGLGDAASKGEWAHECALIPLKAWQRALCTAMGTARRFAAARTYQVAAAELVGVLVGADDDPCDNPPDDSEGSTEYDPTDGTATPGDTASQRLLNTAAPADDSPENPDCSAVDASIKDLKRVRKAFEDTKPNPGEDGTEYAKRIEEGLLGLGSGGAVSPMQTTEHCTIIVNEAYYRNQPPVIREADCAHEKHHQAKCRWARENYTGGIMGYVTNPNNYRQEELEAYQAGIDYLENWKRQNGCK